MLHFFKALTMARLFWVLAIFCSFMIITAGSGAYLLSQGWVSDAKKTAAVVISKAVSQTLSAQIVLLNKTLDKLLLEPSVIETIKTADPAGLAAMATRLEQQFPDVLKIRFFIPGMMPTDDQMVPKLGFADIEMVRKTFEAKQLPAIQGDQGVDRHLALTGRIMQNDQVLGVVLVSLKFDFIGNSVKEAAATEAYIELKQDKLVIGVSGEKMATGDLETVELKVPHTDWNITYYYIASASLVDNSKILTIVTVPLLLMLLAFFATHRKLSKLLAEDVNAIIKAVKDLMATQKLHSTYSVHLTEMAGVISTLAQFKRVMDSDKSKSVDTPNTALKSKLDTKPAVDDFDDLQLDNFFDDN